MEKAIGKETLIHKDFVKLQKGVFKLFSSKDTIKELDSIKNLALLSVEQNSALSNSMFVAKRYKIIKMDKSGEYIPFCTKMVFLKYYTESEDFLLSWTEQAWTKRDGNCYIDAIETKLGSYLPKKTKNSRNK